MQLHFLPTSRYLDLMRTESPHLIDWYLDWALDGAASARPLETAVQGLR